jgi:hypothetical protein
VGLLARALSRAVELSGRFLWMEGKNKKPPAGVAAHVIEEAQEQRREWREEPPEEEPSEIDEHQEPPPAEAPPATEVLGTSPPPGASDEAELPESARVVLAKLRTVEGGLTAASCTTHSGSTVSPSTRWSRRAGSFRTPTGAIGSRRSGRALKIRPNALPRDSRASEIRYGENPARREDPGKFRGGFLENRGFAADAGEDERLRPSRHRVAINVVAA